MLQLIEYTGPECCTLCIADPDAQNVLFTIRINTKHAVNTLVYHVPILFDIEKDSIKIDHWVEFL